jgi:hypothetical protein
MSYVSPPPCVCVGVEVGAVIEETSRGTERGGGKTREGGNRDAPAEHAWRATGLC